MACCGCRETLFRIGRFRDRFSLECASDKRPHKTAKGPQCSGRNRMKSILRSAALVALLAAAASPALAQKKGGSLTVGVELDIPGFDPLKVGVYDTSANIAAALLFDTPVALGDD